ncbi:TPA: ketol-acid reductoisomerase [Candidatus Peregrinibacteria bacterium]|nr:ketol-acid reductoisomerase [Candidatus Peregrinibacteria bacterium]
MQIYHDSDADLSILNNKKIVVIGYGAQGRAQARMMHQSGLNIVVGVRENGKSWQQAQTDGLTVLPIAKAVAQADIIHILIPDETQKAVYESEILPNLIPGNILSFSHGFNIVFKRITPPEGVGIIMVAPKAPGTEEYKQYEQGFGVPALIAIEKNTAEGNAKNIALAMAKAMFFTKAGVLECTFGQETYEDLFGEQAVLCGGVTELMKTGFEVLIEAGYPPELAYFECIHEMKLIVDLIYEGGLARMWEVVSNTAEYGGHTRGSRLITPQVKEEMKKILKEVEDGTFAKEWMEEADKNQLKNLLAMRQKESEHPAEIVGKKIRGMFEK